MSRELQILILFWIFYAESKEIRAFFTKLECASYAPDLVVNYSCELRPSGVNGSLAMFAHIRLSRDIENLTSFFKFSVKRGKNLDNYISAKIDACKALGQLHDNHLLRMILNEIHRVSNFPLKCPFRKNIDYYLKGYQINADLIPKYVPDLNFVSSSTYSVKKRKIFFYLNTGTIEHHRKKG